MLLGLTVIAVVFYSSCFYLGNEETHNELKEVIIKSLVLRTLGFAMLGIPTTIAITIIELLANKKDNKNYIILKKLNLVVSIILAASLIGSTIFFFM